MQCDKYISIDIFLSKTEISLLIDTLLEIRRTTKTKAIRYNRPKVLFYVQKGGL